jgi:YD repeat-containing protein
MSTKTLRKRIALVAVATLGAGVLSAAPASANAVITTGTEPGRGIVTAFSKTGSAATATMTADGTIFVNVAAAASSGVSVTTVSGGTFTGAASGVASYNTANTQASSTANTAVVSLGVKPNAGVTSMVVRSYNASVSTANLLDTLTVTVVPASSVGALSASTSFANLHTSAAGSSTTYTDTAGASVRTNGNFGFIDWSINDANSVDMPATTVVSASATNGALVSFTAGADAISSAVTTTGANGTVYVKQPTTNAPVSTTVTLSVNGAVWTSKSLTITGDVASIKIENITDGRTASSGTVTGDLRAYAYDSAGNLVARTISAVGSLYNSVVSGTDATIATSATTFASANYTCASAGTSTVQYTIVNTALVRITSPAVAVRCSGDPYTYTASLDKAAYKQGEIATLTITAKDSKGNLANGVATLGDATRAVTVTGAQMTPVTTPSTADTFSSAAGQKVYKFTVGTTAGSYNMIVDLPRWNASGDGDGSSQTVAYTVASAGGTSNEDVLKAIVSLIASINKQIAALQKALLRR